MKQMNKMSVSALSMEELESVNGGRHRIGFGAPRRRIFDEARVRGFDEAQVII